MKRIQKHRAMVNKVDFIFLIDLFLRNCIFVLRNKLRNQIQVIRFFWLGFKMKKIIVFFFINLLISSMWRIWSLWLLLIFLILSRLRILILRNGKNLLKILSMLKKLNFMWIQSLKNYRIFVWIQCIFHLLDRHLVVLQLL